jgi:hypothetical protein
VRAVPVRAAVRAVTVLAQHVAPALALDQGLLRGVLCAHPALSDALEDAAPAGDACQNAPAIARH